MILKNISKCNWKDPQTPSKACLQASHTATVTTQFIVNYGTLFMGVFSCATISCQSTSGVSGAQFLLGQPAADTKLLPKLQPVQLYSTAGLDGTAVSWQIQDTGKV